MSRQSGTPSSPSLRSTSTVCADLGARVAREPLNSLIKALGPGASLHLVGGTVRDAFLGSEEIDFDLATSLPAEETLSRLQAQGIHALDVGMRHGTIVAAIGGENIEITTFRKILNDGSVGSGSDILEDLAGRDFTINAIAFSIADSVIVDPWDGKTDLEQQILRAVGDPTARLREDPLRLLRLVRFGPAAGRTVESTSNSSAASLAQEILTVSPERIRVEFDRILMSDFPSEALRYMLASGLLAHLLPEVLPAVGFDQNEFHTESVFDHTLSVITNTPRDRILRWVALFHDLGKPHTLSIGEDGRRHFYGHEQVSGDLARTIMKRLKFSHADATTIEMLVREHMRTLDCKEPGMRRILRDVGDQYERWHAFKIADATPTMDQQEFSNLIGRFDSMVQTERNRAQGPVYGKLAIDGNDLIALGVRPGPKLGAILKQAEEAVIDNPDLNSRDKLLEFAQKMITN